jgi:hypothetical protein
MLHDYSSPVKPSLLTKSAKGKIIKLIKCLTVPDIREVDNQTLSDTHFM